MEKPPVLRVKNYEVDPMLFSHGFPRGCGPYQCDGACCCDGVWVDIKERDRILEEKELIKKYMDETQNKNHEEWFAEYWEDPDFASGKAVGTTINNKSCVFLNKEGRCIIQVATTMEGRDRWDLKPFYCVMFPVSVAEKTLTFDEHMEGEDAACCNIYPEYDRPMFESCRDELIYALGEDGYRQMSDHYNKYKEYYLNNSPVKSYAV